MSRSIFPPVATAEYADKIAAAVARGTLKVMSHWLGRATCQSELDRHHAGGALLPLKGRYVPTATIIRVAGDAECGFGPEPAAPTALQGRRSVRVSGKHLIEGTDGRVNGPVPAIGLAVASRPFDDQEVRHVA